MHSKQVQIACRMCLLALFLAVFSLLGCTRSVAERTQSSTVAAASLIAQFETVFYSKAGLVASTGSYKQLPEQGANVLRFPFADLLGGLESLDSRASSEMLGRADAVLVGAKDFRSPAALGDVQSQFCYVVTFKGHNTFALGKSMTKFPSASQVDGAVWKWSAKRTEGRREPTPFYATQVADSYLLISNNMDDLRATAQRLSAADPGLLPSSIREWESLSQHEVWGYRRYRHTETNKAAAGTMVILSDAEALSFFVDLKQRSGVLSLFSSTETQRRIDSKHMFPVFTQVNSGRWETRVALSGNETLQEMVNVMGMFGFGIYA